MIISPHQIKAARALLDWSQDDLAHATDLSIATIRKIELGHISPRQTTMQAVRGVLEEAGLEFMSADGVRRRPDEVMTYLGDKGHKDFFQDILDTARKTGADILIVETAAFSFLGSPHALDFMTRVARETLSNVLCLLTDDIDIPVIAPSITYRQISRGYVDPMPLCVCGDKFSMLVEGSKRESKILAIHSAHAAKSLRRQFFSMWDKATMGTENAGVSDEKRRGIGG